MKRVGWEGNPAFDQRVFAEIYTASGGVPRRINQIVNRLLLLGAVDQRTRIDGVMLSQVLSELTEDGTLSLMRHVSKSHSNTQIPVRERQPLADSAAPEQVEPADIAGIAHVEAALAERDAQIVELQQAVLELANASDAHAQAVASQSGQTDHQHDLSDRIAALEGRLLEQDRTIRHTLTMLIEWIEAGDTQRVAA